MQALVLIIRFLLEREHSSIDVPLRGLRKEFYDTKAKGVLLYTNPIS
jgi:hypothetical protein